MSRRTALAVRLGAAVVAAAVAVASASGEPAPQPPGYGLVAQLLAPDAEDRAKAVKKLAKTKDRSLVPGIVDALFFSRREARPELCRLLDGLVGRSLECSFYPWVEHVGADLDLEPRPGYRAFKQSLFARIDPAFTALLDPGLPIAIRPQEIVWGGVRRDGIPSLDRPATIAAGEATYLEDGETVYGVSLGGEQRAYPDRILSWHEMANDVVGGEPVTLSFCTLCGSAVLFSGRTGDGARTFGTSGLLYRSNKLMYDRETSSLWNQLTGEPVVGPLVGSGARLEVLPMTRTRWGDWRRRYPGTRVLSLDQPAGKRAGFRYLPGAADKARAGVAFPVWQKSDRLPREAEVYALRAGEAAKAYPLEAAFSARVINDTVGGLPLLVVADAASGAVRAYRRGAHTFAPGATEHEVLDEEGRAWRAEEEALVPAGHDAAPLPRHPGHVSFWFGWYGFFPGTEVYGTPAA